MVIQKPGSEVELDEITACPECKSEHLVRDYTRGEMTCSGCGLVIDDNFIDSGPEWRAFERKARAWRRTDDSDGA